MAKFHIKDNGEPGICTAQPGNCRLGTSDSEHYPDKESARKGYEKKMNEIVAAQSRANKNRVLKPYVFYTLIDTNTGTVVTDNAVIAEMPKDPPDDFYDNPFEYIDDKTMKNIREINDLSDFKDPVFIEEDTETILDPRTMIAIPDYGFSEEDRELISSNDNDAREFALRRGTPVFAKVEKTVGRSHKDFGKIDEQIEMDMPFTVNEDGDVVPSSSNSSASIFDYGPETTYDSETDEVTTLDGWETVNGFSGQEGYTGPLMHSSEVMSGSGMEAYVRENPGKYAVVVPFGDSPDEIDEETGDPKFEQVNSWVLLKKSD